MLSRCHTHGESTMLTCSSKHTYSESMSPCNEALGGWERLLNLNQSQIKTECKRTLNTLSVSLCALYGGGAASRRPPRPFFKPFNCPTHTHTHNNQQQHTPLDASQTSPPTTSLYGSPAFLLVLMGGWMGGRGGRGGNHTVGWMQDLIWLRTGVCAVPARNAAPHPG